MATAVVTSLPQFNGLKSQVASVSPLKSMVVVQPMRRKGQGALGARCDFIGSSTNLVMEARRSGDFGASIWDDDYVQSLRTSPYRATRYLKEVEKLKNEVKATMDDTMVELDQLELIDNLQRLHISHHLEHTVQMILQTFFEKEKSCPDSDIYKEKDLHVTALKFRLLRQHGYHVPQVQAKVFCGFMDKDGNFKASLADDVKGLVSLYEASFLSMEGETILDLAKDFSIHHLKGRLEQIRDPILAEQVKHALELPLHRRVQKLEAKWFVQVYESRPDANLSLVRLDKLDFNMVQSIYQDELKDLSRWYKETGLEENLKFARHRLAECFFWALGFIPEEHFGYPRAVLTKVAVLITIIDDIYDVYGTLDELEVFTETIKRWDINVLDRLPKYMRICFLALFNSTNELAYHILRDQGLNIISNLRKLWEELSGAFYLEARWYHSGYFPSTNEYLNNAWVSSSVPVLIFYAYFSIINPINEEELQSLEEYPGIIRWPSMVFRLADDLADDLGTTSDEIKRGDVPKSIQCYMRDTGCSEEAAREYVKHTIDELLKKMNKEILMEKPVKSLGQTAMNIARMSLCYYQHGDGFGLPYYYTKEKLVSLIVNPIPMP